MGIIFLVILLDLIGFGIMIPLLPYFAFQLGGGPEIATLCMALYGVGMFISTPILGRLSDYYGRRPVLLISMVGAVIGYLILTMANTIILVAIARLFSGLMAGNLAAAQAYITDITTIKNRAKGMGVIGAAFGLGFIIGPTLGTLLAGDSFENANLWLVGMTSASLSAAAFFVILFFLPESLNEKTREKLLSKKRPNQFEAIKSVSLRPIIFQFVIAGLLYNVAAGLAESILPIWVNGVGVASGPHELMPLLLVSGLTLAVIQGGLIGPLARRFGEKKLLNFGILIFATGLLNLGLAGGIGSYYYVMGALSMQFAGAAFIITSLQSLVSMRASEDERGLVMGVYSSAGTLGRIIGTILTGIIYANIHMNASYFSAAGVALGMFLLVVILERKIGDAISTAPTNQDKKNKA